MELREVLRRRRMVRAYLPDPVDPLALARILAAGRRAPSAGHSQGQSFVVVTDPADRAQIAALCGEDRYVARGLQPWLSVAPVHIIPCVRPDAYRERYARQDKASSRGPDAWATPWWWVDGGQALALLLLATTAEGLGAGLLDVADNDGLRGLLGIPGDVHPFGLVTVGHPDPSVSPVGSARTVARRPSSEAIHRGRWHG